MSNIYTTFELIKNLSNSKNLNASQHDFLSKLLDKKNLRRQTSSDALNVIIRKLEEEFARSSYFSIESPLASFRYKSTLNRILQNLYEVQKKREEIKTFSQTKHKKFLSIAKKMDTLYEETEKSYHGKIILPVIQGADFRLGQSGGECFGYAVEWAISLLHHKKPFGICLNNPPNFSPIKMNSSAGQKYPDLNHLAALTETISDYQSHQRRLERFFKESSNPIVKNTHINQQIFPHFYISTTKIAENLINLVDTDRAQSVYEVNLLGYLVGHAVGFCKKNGKYHFFDSNSGWFCFDKAQDFKQWLPFYFKHMTYDNLFLETKLKTFSIKSNEDEEKNPSLTTKITTAIILSPIILTITTTFLAYFFGFRGCVYGINTLRNIGKGFYNFFNHPDQETFSEIEKKRNDEAVQQKMQQNVFPSLNTSYRTLTALLDIPFKDIRATELKARANPEFQVTTHSASKLKQETILLSPAAQTKALSADDTQLNIRAKLC